MLSVVTAAALRAAGLPWEEPGPGDRFVVVDRGMDAEVFVLSDMTIEARDYPTGRILGFNGTTEWALDSVAVEQALWLPREDQLRAVLGRCFRALTTDGDRWHVDVDGVEGVAATARRTTARSVEEAYALAVLAVLAARAGGSPARLLPVAAEGFSWRVGAVPDDAWERPTPAGGWSVRDLVGHLVREHLQAPHLLRGESPDDVGDRYGDDVLGDDPAAAWDRAIGASLRAWAAVEDAERPVTSSQGRVPASGYASQMLLDLVVHAWDLARGAGLDDRLDDACVQEALAWARPNVDADGGVFGAPVPTSSDRLQDQLVALTGRGPATGGRVGGRPQAPTGSRASRCCASCARARRCSRTE